MSDDYRETLIDKVDGRVAKIAECRKQAEAQSLALAARLRFVEACMR